MKNILIFRYLKYHLISPNLQGKKVLLPLKKNEKKEVIDVYETKLNKSEKKKSVLLISFLPFSQL